MEEKKGFSGILYQILHKPLSSVVLMAAIAVLGISSGLINYNIGKNETTSAGQLDMALPPMASKDFKANKYDNASLAPDTINKELKAFENLSLEEKLLTEKKQKPGAFGRGFGSNEELVIEEPREKNWESRDEVRAHYGQKISRQHQQSSEKIQEMARPAQLSAAELAERHRRDEALERAARLEHNAINQLALLQQQQDAASKQQHLAVDAYGFDPYEGSGIKPASVSLPNIEDYVEYEQRERPQNAFYELKGARKMPEMIASKPVPNAIEAVIHGEAEEVTVTNGSTVKLRLLQDIQVGAHLLPKHSLLSGECRISGERIHVLLTSVRIQSSIIPIQLRVYDLDGHAGIYVPDMAIKNQLAQTGSQAVTGGSLQMPYMIPQGGSVGARVVAQSAAQGVNMAANGVRSIAAKKMGQQKASIKPNYKIYLKQD